ncbi:MAG: sigma-70 family RNA polymerase sigma factor [Actinomycetia bacterium]|nr:sigma-70 family RNA polymerase sigma factor [Actinomycetes bacterium]
MTPTGSFEDFYSQHRSRLVGALTSFVGDIDMAAEAVDEAMARAFARWSRLKRHPEPAGWVFVTARNVARRNAKRRGRQPSHIDEATTAEPPGGEMWLLVADLPDRQREVIVLRHIAGLTERAIGDALGITRGTVSSTLRDAYRSLNIAMHEDESTGERA